MFFLLCNISWSGLEQPYIESAIAFHDNQNMAINYKQYDVLCGYVSMKMILV